MRGFRLNRSSAENWSVRIRAPERARIVPTPVGARWACRNRAIAWAGYSRRTSGLCEGFEGIDLVSTCEDRLSGGEAAAELGAVAGILNYLRLFPFLLEGR